MIRSIRRIFTAVVRNSFLNDEAFITFVAEAEQMLNNRPAITAVSSDAKKKIICIYIKRFLERTINIALLSDVFLQADTVFPR